MRLVPRAKERVRREFLPEDYTRALKILNGWDSKACAPGERSSRMLAAILNLAVGNLSYLEHYIAEAEANFRDVLVWGKAAKGNVSGASSASREGVADPTEEAFLESIRASPSDNTPRLVYADWLEERGDPRANYLRVLCEWLDSRTFVDQQLIEREGELRISLDRRWLARIRGLPVREKPKKG